jgi:hypothetical protein
MLWICRGCKRYLGDDWLEGNDVVTGGYYHLECADKKSLYCSGPLCYRCVELDLGGRGRPIGYKHFRITLPRRPKPKLPEKKAQTKTKKTKRRS